MADHDRVAEMLMECTPSVYDSRAERRAAIAEILRREYGRRVPDPAIEKAREALSEVVSWCKDTQTCANEDAMWKRVATALALLEVE